MARLSKQKIRRLVEDQLPRDWRVVTVDEVRPAAPGTEGVPSTAMDELVKTYSRRPSLDGGSKRIRYGAKSHVVVVEPPSGAVTDRPVPRALVVDEDGTILAQQG